MAPSIRILLCHFCEVCIQLGRFGVVVSDRLITMGPESVFVERVELDGVSYCMAGAITCDVIKCTNCNVVQR